MRRIALSLWLVAAGGLLFCPSAEAAFHLWDTVEIFSNADGTIQFVEMHTTFNSQHFMDGHALTSNSTCYVFDADLASSATANKRMLLGTAAFAALPGAPPVDYLIPDNFFDVNGDTITLKSSCAVGPQDVFTFTSGELPTDGIHSLNRDKTTGVNSPTNFAGTTGSVDASGAGTPPVVPDGSAGSPLLVERLNAAGTELRISFDDLTCTGAADHHLVYGGVSDLPAALGGTYLPAGSLCDVGAGSPFDWNTAPDASAGFIWWVLIADDDSTTEGSWGRDGDGGERAGPGSGGASDECGISTKDTANTCGE